MKRYMRYALGGVIIIVLAGLAATLVHGGSYTVTVTATQNGTTQQNIGATEGCARFVVSDLVDVGFKNYRIWAGMSRVEPVDDNGVFGTPTIAQIKADPNVIPWSVWDTQFNRPDSYFWSSGCPGGGAQVSLKDMLTALKANGIKPVVTLRNVDNNDGPAWAMALNPPNSTEDWNEWWEFVFAWVYWANVRNNLDVHDWQVHNEPDNLGQGWDGTLADYIVYTQQTYDAIKYVYDTYLPGETFKLYAPVSTHANEWITESLIQNDAILDVVDWHRYGPPADEAAQLHAWINQYNSDGVHEPLYLSEWGDYRGAYTSVGSCMNYSAYLANMADPATYVASSALFPFYDWTSTMIGLVGPAGEKRECYWAFRLMTRGLQGAKPSYTITSNIPTNVWLYPVAAKDTGTNTLYVELVNKSTQGHTITLDLSAHALTGTATIRQYSATYKDQQTGTMALSNGRLTISVAKASVVQVILPLP